MIQTDDGEFIDVSGIDPDLMNALYMQAMEQMQAEEDARNASEAQI